MVKRETKTKPHILQKTTTMKLLRYTTTKTVKGQLLMHNVLLEQLRSKCAPEKKTP